MKKVCLTIGIFLFALLSLYPDHYSAPLKWLSPEIMGQGGGVTASVRGYNALFTNPAGLCSDDWELNILTLQPYLLLDFVGIEEIEEAIDLADFLGDQMNTNGFGLGFQNSLGFTAGGIGLALFTSVDSYFHAEESVLGTMGDASVTVGIVGGYARQFEAAGWTWRVGGDLRFMRQELVKDIGLESFKDFLESYDNDEKEEEDIAIDVFEGYGLGVDLGVQASRDWLTLGLSLRDVGGTVYKMDKVRAEALDDLLSGGGEPLGEDVISPMTLRLGVAAEPELPRVSSWIDATFSGELVVPLVDDSRFYRYEVGSFWTRINFGAELEFWEILALRAGFHGGYLSTGIGLDLLFLEIQAALFSQEYGTYAGDQRVMGGSIDFSIRF